MVDGTLETIRPLLSRLVGWSVALVEAMHLYQKA